MADESLTFARLREFLHYDPEIGVFIRKVRTSSRGMVGERADRPHPTTGYYYVKLECQRYLAHRLAWFYMHGEWPAQQIDHMDGDRSNNRFANLRDVSPSANQHNRRKTYGVSGFMGVYPKQGRWMAAVSLRSRQIFLGYFDTPEEGHQAYLEGKRNYHEDVIQ